MFTPLDNIPPINYNDPVNRNHSLNRGKVGWWLTLPDLSGGSKWYDLMGLTPGTLNGFSTVSTGWKSSPRSGSYGHLLFDGASYVDCGSADTRFDFTTGNFSVSFWINISTFSNSPVIIDRGTYTTNGWYIYSPGTGALEFHCESSGVDGMVTTGSGALVTNTWQHFTVVRTGTTTAQIYRNGILLSTSGSIANCASCNTGLLFGRYVTSSNFVNGAMDDISIWNRALSATEVAELYQISRSGYGDMLNRYDRFGASSSIVSILLAGQISGIESTSGSVGVTSTLAGNNTVLQSSSGTIVVSTSLLGAITASESSGGTLTVSTPGTNVLAGNINGAFSIAASMGVSDRLIADIIASESGSGTLSVSSQGSVHLVGSTGGVFVIHGVLTVGRQTGPILYFFKKSGGGRGFIRS